MARMSRAGAMSLKVEKTVSSRERLKKPEVSKIVRSFFPKKYKLEINSSKNFSVPEHCTDAGPDQWVLMPSSKHQCQLKLEVKAVESTFLKGSFTSVIKKAL